MGPQTLLIRDLYYIFA